MTAPAYATDLANIDTAEAIGSWVETGTWTAGTAPALEPDFFIQGANCIAKYMTSGGVGVGGWVMNFGSGITVPSPGAVFMWMMAQCPNNTDTEANGGLRLIIGSSSTAFNAWKLRGKDTNPYGGWTCYAVDPTVTVDYTVGSPTATKQWFGGAVNQLANAKGGTGIDVIRYGRGELKCEFGSTADGYATFVGAAAQNDNESNRWGLCQAIDGGYLQQGLFLMGSATNAVDFRDSNTSVLIANTKKVVAAFNTFEVRNASSRVDWTNISFLALGTVSRGRFLATDNADINITSCSFTDLDTFDFLSNSTVLTSIFRRTGQITTGGGTFTGCTVDNNRAASAMLASSPANAALISDTSFISDGTGHAIEITGTAANFTLTGNTYSGYAASDGSTGNEAIFVNIASGSLNLTISGGDVPSIRTAGCTVTVIASAVTVTAKAATKTGVAIASAQVLMKAATGGPFPFDVTVTISNSGTTATVTHTGHGLATNDKVWITGASLNPNNGVFPITKIDANSYSYTMASSPGSSPTGTIKATFVILSGTTDVNGEITMSRVFPSNQPFSGWARKSASAPYYKEGALNGTVNSSTGASPTAVLVED